MIYSAGPTGSRYGLEKYPKDLGYSQAGWTAICKQFISIERNRLSNDSELLSAYIAEKTYHCRMSNRYCNYAEMKQSIIQRIMGDYYVKIVIEKLNDL